MSKGSPRTWEPLTIGPAACEPSHGMAKAFYETDGRQHWFTYRDPQRAIRCLGFRNRLYNGNALVFEDGSMHLSFKRNDRAAVRDWRHFQAIKNEVAGPEREAIEIFPPESMLVDCANEYHLFVLPEGLLAPLGFIHRQVADQVQDGAVQHDHALYRQTGQSGYRQRSWEPGLPTGLGADERSGS